MPNITSILKSRTIQFSIALGVLSVLQGFIFHLPLSPLWQAFVGCLIATSIVLLRAITTVPLSQK